MNHNLVFPMFAMVVLTFLVGVITLITRIRSVRDGKVDFRYFKTFSVGEPSEAVLKTSRHFVNLFEVPTLFYAGCLAAMITGASGFFPLLFAWLFVGSRAVHAVVHLGRNKIIPRMSAFLFGFGCTFALWICVVIQAMQS